MKIYLVISYMNDRTDPDLYEKDETVLEAFDSYEKAEKYLLEWTEKLDEIKEAAHPELAYEEDDEEWVKEMNEELKGRIHVELVIKEMDLH